jgi:flavin reductase (DIM6/NTAB) family NADH-FMN oxidoreductase RutF
MAIAEQPVKLQRDETVFNATGFRGALSMFATGVTVVTTYGEEHAYGMTANSFSSVSLDPPLILVCVITGTRGTEIIQRNGVFAVNILSADQEPLSRFFAAPNRPRGSDAFRDIPHRTAATRSPILDGVRGWLDCRVTDSHEAGDHYIFIGEVLALGSAEDRAPLLFHNGRYCFVTR